MTIVPVFFPVLPGIGFSIVWPKSTLAFRESVIPEIGGGIDPEIFAKVDKFRHGVMVDRDPFLHIFFYRDDLLFPVGVNSVLPVGQGGIAQFLQVSGEMTFDGLRVSGSRCR